MRKRLPVCVAVLALAACQPIAEPDPQDTGPVLAVQFGDSLSWDSREEATGLYTLDTTWRVSLNHYPGTELNTDTWVNRYPSVGQGSTVVLALGTNDLANDATLDETKAAARAAIAAVTDAGAARVVIPTVNETSAALTGRLSRTQQWNAWLWQVEASTHANYRAVDVVDWAAFSAGRTDWLRADHVHHTAVGQTAYAQFLYDARLPGGQ